VYQGRTTRSEQYLHKETKAGEEIQIERNY